MDRISFLDWICKNHLQYWFFSLLRFGFSPKLLARLADQSNSYTLDDYTRLHTLATSYLRAGNTVKTTGMARTRHADMCVLTAASEKNDPRLLEVGVSDGISSLGLLNNSTMFSEIKLTDRFPRYYLKEDLLSCKIYDADGVSHGMKVLGILFNTAGEKNNQCANISSCKKVETINPKIKCVSSQDVIHKFDIFNTVYEQKFDIIKCSNLLNLIYFGEKQIFNAIDNILKSLKIGGCLIISHNNSKYRDEEAVLCARQIAEGQLEIYHQINEHELLSVIEKSDNGHLFAK